VTPEERARLAEARPIDPVANEAYLRGRYYFNEGINRPRPREFSEFLEKSVVSYRAAIERAPEYAPAHAALAQAYAGLATWVAPEQFSKAREAAQRAVELDETLAQAHAALAFTINWMEWDWAGAESHYRRASELNPSLGNEGHHGYAILLSAVGRHSEAIAEIELAEQLDPLTLIIKENAGVIFLNARQYERAIGKLRRLIELEPNSPFVHVALAQAYVLKGMCDNGVSEAQRAVQLAPGTVFPEATLAWAFAKCGRREDALRILQSLQPAKRDNRCIALACINTALGMRDAALTWLERAHRRRLMWLPWFLGDPRLDPLRGDPRFRRVAEAIGIPQTGEIRP
jgi:tetratricopeptide (TPR) repeat protein